MLLCERRSMPRPAHSEEIPEISLADPVVGEIAAHEGVIAVILFGSVARGQARTTSDIDLCIVCERTISETEWMDLLSYGSDKIDISLFFDLPITIRFRVIQEGKVLACNHPTALNTIRADTVREYLDIAPLIRRTSKRVLGLSAGA